MSRQLVESILSGKMLEANDMVEAKMAEIRERKMYEMKRMYASNLYEAEGGKDPNELRKKGYKRASEVLGPSSYDTRHEKSYQKQTKGKKGAKTSEPKEDKFGSTKPNPLKKDKSLRTMDRLKKNLERYNTLKARGSKTADDRIRKIAVGYSGKIAKQAVKNVASGTAKAAERVANSPVVGDLKSIGFRNI